MCVYFYLLVDVRQVSVVPVPVAFQVEPVLSFVVRVGSLLKPPGEREKRQRSSPNGPAALVDERYQTHRKHNTPPPPRSNQIFGLNSSKQTSAFAVVPLVLRRALYRHTSQHQRKSTTKTRRSWEPNLGPSAAFLHEHSKRQGVVGNTRQQGSC